MSSGSECDTQATDTESSEKESASSSDENNDLQVWLNDVFINFISLAFKNIYVVRFKNVKGRI